MHHLVSGCESSLGHPTDCDFPVFGTPILLPVKPTDTGTPALPPPSVPISPVAAPPLPPTHHSSPPPLAPRPQYHQDPALFEWMRCLMRAGAHRLDALQASQLVAQEASGVMAASMLRQQGEMREVAVWEAEVEAMMREMGQMVDGEGSDL